MDADPTIDSFLRALADGTPTPGGGGAAALAGALGAALAAMTARFTAGRKRYASVADRVAAAIASADEARLELQALVAADARAYGAVIAAQGLAREGEQQASARERALQGALVEATRVPLKIAARCAAVLALCHELALIGNRNLVSDAAAGALLAEAGLQAAALNVHTNLTYIADAQQRAELERELHRHLDGAPQARAATLAVARERAAER